MNDPTYRKNLGAGHGSSGGSPDSFLYDTCPDYKSSYNSGKAQYDAYSKPIDWGSGGSSGPSNVDVGEGILGIFLLAGIAGVGWLGYQIFLFLVDLFYKSADALGYAFSHPRAVISFVTLDLGHLWIIGGVLLFFAGRGVRHGDRFRDNLYFNVALIVAVYVSLGYALSVENYTTGGFAEQLMYAKSALLWQQNPGAIYFLLVIFAVTAGIIAELFSEEDGSGIGFLAFISGLVCLVAALAAEQAAFVALQRIFKF